MSILMHQLRNQRKGALAFLQQGFSIIELLIYMAILSVILVLLTTIFTSALDVTLDSQSTSAVQEDGQFVIARLGYIIHSASAITAPSLGTSANTLQLVLPSGNVSYSVDGSGDLNEFSGGVSNQLNGYNTTVSGVSFQTLGNLGGKNSVVVSFTLTSRVARTSGIQDSQTFQTTVSTR